ncbi:metallophosphoesterase [Enorma massiliensis]|uniref:metallophosphoesterase n=1 Tax=Enorma massiliensis TaxID=1472761 RepID=UPI0023F3498E|nr:metallophosphoesterase [Enorma massiliensis]
MSMLILQLTDIHTAASFCNGKDDKKIQEIVRALPRQDNLKKVVFALTGDLTYSGKRDEFDSFHKLLIELSKECESVFNMKPTILAVPGNHDITDCETFKKENLSSLLDLNAYYHKYDANLEEFASYCRNNGIIYPESPSKVILMGSWGEHQINCILINTAPGSVLSDSDKGDHFLPFEVSDTFPNNPNALNILLMHHGLDFLEEESQKRIELAIKQNATILLAGHEHKGKSRWTGKNGNVRVVKGGEFCQDQWKESSFKCILLRDDEKAFEYHYFWSHDDDAFYCSLKEDITEQLRKALLCHRESVSSITGKNHLLLANSMEDQFVFPDLRVSPSGATDSTRILPDVSSVLDLVKDHPFISILGGALCGKSTLLEQVYLASLERGIQSIYLTRDNCTKSIKRTLDSVIADQCSVYDIGSQFNRTPLNGRIIFIDDFDTLKFNNRQADTIKEIYSRFGAIVCTMKDSSGQFRASLEEVAEAPLYLRIGKFSKVKRDILIKKVCVSQGILTGKEQDSIIRAIDSAAHEHSSLFPLTPGFICEYLRYFFSNSKGNQDYRDLLPFSDIYESNLKHRLASKATKMQSSKYEKLEKAQLAIELFSELAMYMYSQRLSQIDVSAFSAVTCTYLDQRAIQDVSPSEVLDLGRGAGVLTQEPRTLLIEFTRSEYYAFFVARSLNNDHLQNENQALVRRILDELCFGINELVVVFLSLLKEDRALIKMICDIASQSIKDIEPIDFCVGFDTLNECASMGLAITNDNERRKTNTLIDQIEQNQTINEITYRDVFDYDLNELSKPGYRVARSIRLAEIAGDSISSNYLTMLAVDKEAIRSLIYEVPKRAIGYLVPPLLDTLDTNAQQLKELLEKETGELYSDETCKQILQRFSLCLCIGLYSSIAYHCARKSTYDYLLDIQSNDACDVVMKLQILANSGNYEHFCDRACREARNALHDNNRLLQLCIALIVNAFININPSVPHHMLDRFSESVFSPFEIKGQAKARLVSENRRVSSRAGQHHR